MYIHIYIYTGRPPGLPSPPMPFFHQFSHGSLFLCVIASCRASLHDSFGTCFSVHLQCSEDCWQSWLSAKT